MLLSSFCLQPLLFLHIVSAQPGTPGFKQTAEGMENLHVSLQQLKHNKAKFLGHQDRHFHIACSLQERRLLRKKKKSKDGYTVVAPLYAILGQTTNLLSISMIFLEPH